MTSTSLIPFSPLTSSELLERRCEATEDCGYRARAVVRTTGRWECGDLEYLTARATLAEEFVAAYALRQEEKRD